MRFALGELEAAVGGRLVADGEAGDAVEVDGASIDSRTLRPGQLFVALTAERDGHDFVGAAAAAGAAAALVARLVPVDIPQLVVDDPAAALAAAGRRARDRISGPVIGITGSVGKTTTKDLMGAIYGRSRPTVASEKSFNNELGVPLTILGAVDGCEVAVLEMGARAVGHIATLCRYAAPTMGVVTVVAPAHVETFGSLEGIARAKTELVAALPPEGIAVLNREAPLVAAMASSTPAAVVWFGGDGDVVAEEVRLDEDLHARFRLRSSWGGAEVRVGPRGEHNVVNALAAAAAALAGGCPLEDVVAGLDQAEHSPWRMDLRTAASGARILNDAYNANPAAMAAGLRAIAALPARRRVAVLGRMAELGDTEVDEHRAVADLAASLGVELIAVGTPLYGSQPVQDVVDALGPLDEHTVVLVKGSRVAGLEQLAETLLRS